jgi:uncharacterized protein GlcG (DUF336 family)
MKTRIGLCAAILLAAPSMAQTPRPGLDYASASTIVSTCVQWATENDRNVAIAVMDNRGMLVAFAHMDGASAAVGELARWKANGSAMFGRATADIGALNPPANLPHAATLTGGVPIYTADGVRLGGVGTSGLRPDEDAACGTAGVEAAGLTTSRGE